MPFVLDIEQARFNMVEQQVRPWDVLDLRVLETLRRVRREAFVPKNLVNQAFSDVMLPLEHGQYMMSPIVEGRLLQALDVQNDERVLEIGTGSGFMTACLAQMAMHVTSVELFDDLSEQAQSVLLEQGCANVTLETGDASRGWSDPHFYDVIAITGAMMTVPDTYKYKLNIGGRLFVVRGPQPVMQAILITREGEQHWREESLFETDLPYLEYAAAEARFIF